MSSQNLKAPSSSEEGVGGGGPTREHLLQRAAEMRRNLTEPERRLWMQLRASRLGGHKFRRQAVFGKRIVDFFCPAKGLVVEVDGDTHDSVVDAARDQDLLDQWGLATIRFANRDVMQNMEGMLFRLTEALQAAGDRWRGRNHPPTPSFEKEGES